MTRSAGTIRDDPWLYFGFGTGCCVACVGGQDSALPQHLATDFGSSKGRPLGDGVGRGRHPVGESVSGCGKATVWAVGSTPDLSGARLSSL